MSLLDQTLCMIRKTHDIQLPPLRVSQSCWRERDVSSGSQRISLTTRKVREGFPEEVTAVAAGGRPEGYEACGGSESFEA